MAAHWSRAEVEATVADYFAMLEAEHKGEAYSKSAHRRALQRVLNNRTDTAIERKHMNVSAAVIELGFPYISGYKPLGNYQQLLADVVLERLEGRDDLIAVAAEDAERPVDVPTVEDILAALTDPPERGEKARRTAEPDWRRQRRGRHTNYFEQEARNRQQGRAGEQFVVRFEQARLIAGGRERLAADVEHVAVTRGDGLGYDVLSFEETGRERLIEVKTTKRGKEAPFYVTRGEVSLSRAQPDEFHLYRVFAFTKAPRLFTVPGDLSRTCDLDPHSYVGRVA
jgi:hypothetical protein